MNFIFISNLDFDYDRLYKYLAWFSNVETIVIGSTAHGYRLLLPRR